jgi:hypothetical protein
MESFDYDILNVFEEYEMENKLTKAHIKSCRDICQKYENRLYEKEMTSKFLFFSNFDDCEMKYECINNIKIKDYEIYNDSIGDEMNKKNHYQKFNIYFGENKCEVVFEMNNEFSENGKTKLLYSKFFIDENLIIKKESQKSKDFINLTYVKNLLNTLKIETNIAKFLTLLLKTMNLENMFKNVLEKIKTDTDSYYYNIEWDSTSDISFSDDDGNDDEKED